MNSFWKGAFALVICTAAAGELRAAIIDGDLDTFAPTTGTNYNLTTEGTSDWIHWGHTASNSVNRKSTGGSQISNFTTVKAGSNSVRLTDSPSKASWTDGTSTASASNSPGGAYINNFDGPGRGYQFTVPADQVERILKVYVGTFRSCGTLEATLSDGSAPIYSELLVGNANATVQGVYTIRFAANSPNQTLTIKWTETADLGAADNVTLQAAALKLAVVPEPATMGLMSTAMLMLARRRRR
jgi:hypothetical protein